MKVLKLLFLSRQALMHIMQADISWSERSIRTSTGRPSLLRLHLSVSSAWRECRLLFATTAAMMLTTLFAAVSFLLIIYEITVIFLTILRSIIYRKKQDSTHLSQKSNL